MADINKYQFSSPFIVINKNQVDQEKTIVVIGCSRGGTSMIAGTLRELGVFMGDRMTGSNHEDIEFTTSNINILKSNIAKRNEHYKIWGWKYPHVTEYLSDIIHNLRNPYYIFVFRNIFDVAKSYAKYHDKNIQYSLLDSYSRYSEIVHFASTINKPAMFVSYEKCLENRHTFIDGLISFLDLTSSGVQRNNAIEFINKSGGYKKTTIDDNKNFLSIQPLEALPKLSTEMHQIEYNSTLHNINTDGNFAGANNDPQIIFIPSQQTSFPPTTYFSFNFKTSASNFESRIYIDFGSGFYAMASQAIQLKDGINIFSINFESEFYRLRFDPLNTNDIFEFSNATLHGV